MGVDPTFDCGDFHPTVTTYAHPLLVSKITVNHPTILGPMFVHRNKKVSTYLSFFSALVGDCSDLADLVVYGTDGEQGLAKTLGMQFRDAAHLLCFIHFRRNLSDKLKALGVSHGAMQEILRDMFDEKASQTMGDPSDDDECSVPPCGLVNAESCDDCDSQLGSLCEKWNCLEMECTEKQPLFHAWFKRYEANDVKDCMLASLRSALGLGFPPRIYTINQNKSMNAVIHGKNHYSASNWADFCEVVKKNEGDRVCIDRKMRILFM